MTRLSKSSSRLQLHTVILLTEYISLCNTHIYHYVTLHTSRDDISAPDPRDTCLQVSVHTRAKLSARAGYRRGELNSVPLRDETTDYRRWRSRLPPGPLSTHPHTTASWPRHRPDSHKYSLVIDDLSHVFFIPPKKGGHVFLIPRVRKCLRSAKLGCM